MKLAKAMRYGGELIDAIECDYSDFKRLIPLCPNCGEPVFLRKGGDRVSKLGKEFILPQHWSHFRSVSEEQKAACEARVSGYTDADRQRIQSQARGQRLKLIQRWFWRAWTEKNFNIRLYTSASLKSIMRPALLDEMFYYQGLKDAIHERLKESDVSMVASAGDDNSEEIEGIKAELSALDIRLHRSITSEVLDFLYSRKNRSLWQDALYCCLAYSIDISTEEEAMQIVAELARVARAVPPYTFSDLLIKCGQMTTEIFIGSLFVVPWASEFARLEAEAGQKVTA